ncbi:cyclase family protein [Flavobacteriales bacterium]|nr:cyclase family protein [Flavobacteriales bacterium]
MRCVFERQGNECEADLTKPVDLSLVLAGNGKPNPSAWYVAHPSMQPVRGDGFVGAVAEGGSVNFRDVTFNPHGHGTHTECLGHITPDVHPVDPLFRNQQAHVPCQLITVQPEKRDDDFVIDAACLAAINGPLPRALVVRTLPNGKDKATRSWSNTNPPYFTVDFMDALVRQGVEHLLVDLPSVDREVDGGRLAAHHAFWGLPDNPRPHCTITELVYAPQSVSDGLYLLHLGVAPMDNDAAISRPVLYPVVVVKDGGEDAR